jgi:hypothetical protein
MPDLLFKRCQAGISQAPFESEHARLGLVHSRRHEIEKEEGRMFAQIASKCRLRHFLTKNS